MDPEDIDKYVCKLDDDMYTNKNFSQNISQHLIKNKVRASVRINLKARSHNMAQLKSSSTKVYFEKEKKSIHNLIKEAPVKDYETREQDCMKVNKLNVKPEYFEKYR